MAVSLLDMAQLLLAAIPQVVLSGWAALLLGVAVLLVFLQYRRVAVLEAELYGISKHAPLEQTRHSLVLGLFGGLAGSVVLSVAGVGLVSGPGATSALLYLWPVSILLGAINPRFFCFAYSGTLVAVSSMALGWPRIDIPSVMGLVAVLHLVEALLIRISGDSCATPLSIRGTHGEAIPGFMLQRFWPVPLILPVFTSALGVPVDMPAWWPLISPGAGAEASTALGWQLTPVVVTMGYSDLAISAPPEIRARQSSRVLLGYSLILLLLAIGASHYPPLVWVAAVFSGVGHEAMAVYSGRVQLLGAPYLRRPSRGVGVLDVLPGSVAHVGGLRSGAVIVTVDDFEVNTREQLHEALLASPAYVRVMYRNGRELEQVRLPRPADGLLGLGVILLPEPGEAGGARVRRPAFFRWSRLER